MNHISDIEITIGSWTWVIPQSILVWFALCIIFAVFFYVAGKRIDRADPAKASKGLVYVAEEMLNLAIYVTGNNLKDKVYHYLPVFGTLLFMMAAANLVGLLGWQNPTSNVSFNGTLAICVFLTTQYHGIKKGGLVNRLKELAEPFWFLFPLNIIGELAPVISLTMRLFGNMLAGYLITALVYTLMANTMPFGILGFAVTPFLHMYFDIFSGCIQSFIFFTLSSYFIGQQVADQEE
ncbi:FoF1 ATP synthase subunit A [Catenisphaera adipataccumulans]|jgi:F-type H+-transporting ATPase subunit a|uniref:ATP synthase subunit a n=1 Tax=Catenisphaera adipataccumulans TaxID=700500 RepID=A0A7W8CWS0_9FIRM|nr:FoF1 ATP synthase subunit a [Catenisphaera adipataccumulans]MBB5182399.1 F-type H+-transporting ATPase subunit a [Catenisphaera adipataccumulans]